MKRTDAARGSGSTDEAVAKPARVNTLETFIEQLHAEGVEAGRQDAEQIRARAQTEAAAAIAAAEEAGRKIVAEAEKQAQFLIAEARSELALAARDTQLELREKLSAALTVLLKESLERELGDPGLLSELLRELVGAYVRADSTGESMLEVHVRPELVEVLAQTSPAMLGRALAGAAGLDLRGGLRAAGFEYHVRNAVVEVTPESVAEKLAELITPQLKMLLREAAGDEAEQVRAQVAGETPAPWSPSNAHAGTSR